jgi:hypothetical protein
MTCCWEEIVSIERAGNRRETYSTRLKTVTLFATGENRQVPSGLNKRFPWQYTVPKRLENLKSVFIVTICPWLSSLKAGWLGCAKPSNPNFNARPPMQLFFFLSR